MVSADELIAVDHPLYNMDIAIPVNIRDGPIDEFNEFLNGCTEDQKAVFRQIRWREKNRVIVQFGDR